jgi:hypothetical protein
MPLSDLSESLRAAMPSLSSLPDPMTILAELRELATDLADDLTESPSQHHRDDAGGAALRHAPSLNDFSMGVRGMEEELAANEKHAALLREDPAKLRHLYEVLKNAQKGLHKMPGSSFEQRFQELEAAVKQLEAAQQRAAEEEDGGAGLSRSATPSLLPRAAQGAAKQQPRCVDTALWWRGDSVLVSHRLSLLPWTLSRTQPKGAT